jgi:hypothetical protein
MENSSNAKDFLMQLADAKWALFGNIDPAYWGLLQETDEATKYAPD